MLNDLPIETQFAHEAFIRMVESMSLEQTREYLIKMHEIMLARENFYRRALKGEL